MFHEIIFAMEGGVLYARNIHKIKEIIVSRTCALRAGKYDRYTYISLNICLFFHINLRCFLYKLACDF